MATRLTIETMHYELSHGRSPKGRGSWLFCPFHLRNAPDALDFTVWAPSNLTLTEAKAWLKGKVAELRSTAPEGSAFMAEVWAVMP